jgi:hypothetical protein
VARGKLHNTEGDMVHGIKLPLRYVKVAIDFSVISDAPLPISIEYGEVSTVGLAIGTIVPWPFKLVELIVECKKVNYFLLTCYLIYKYYILVLLFHD